MSRDAIEFFAIMTVLCAIVVLASWGVWRVNRGTPGEPDAVCRDDGSCNGALVCTQTINGSRCLPRRTGP